MITGYETLWIPGEPIYNERTRGRANDNSSTLRGGWNCANQSSIASTSTSNAYHSKDVDPFEHKKEKIPSLLDSIGKTKDCRKRDPNKDLTSDQQFKLAVLCEHAATYGNRFFTAYHPYYFNRWMYSDDDASVFEQYLNKQWLRYLDCTDNDGKFDDDMWLQLCQVQYMHEVENELHASQQFPIRSTDTLYVYSDDTLTCKNPEKRDALLAKRARREDPTSLDAAIAQSLQEYESGNIPSDIKPL